MRRSWGLAAMFAVAALLVAHSSICEQMSYAYDSMGRLRDARSAAGNIFVYRYDLAGNRLLAQQGVATTGVEEGDGEASADVNRDGIVTVDDLAILRGAYGTEMGSSCFVAAADLDGSRIVDLVDLRLWYRGYTQGSWRPGDWTSGAATLDVAWSELAPDGRVDFFDLVALIREWGPVSELSPAARWLDVAPAKPDGLIDGRDLAVFRVNWLSTGDVVEAVGSSSDCVVGDQEHEPEFASATLAIRARDGGGAGEQPIALDIVLEGAARDVICFQLVLDADLDLGWDEAVELGSGETRIVWLGDNAQIEGFHFLDVRTTDAGLLITGASPDVASAGARGSRILCSIAAPRLEEEATFVVRQALLSDNSGAIHRVSDWTGEVSLNPVPAVVTLLQNRPNPFNPITTVKYAVPQTAAVRLQVYDVAGRLIATLVNEVQDRGWYESRWDGRTGDGRPVASGIYFYRLQAGKEIVTNGMSLVR